MRSGCLSLVVSVGLVAAAAILAAASTALLLSFAVSALGQPNGPEKVFVVLVALVAGLAFFLVGRGIWRDLREPAKQRKTPKPDDVSQEPNRGGGS